MHRPYLKPGLLGHVILLLVSLIFGCKDQETAADLQEPYPLESNLFMAKEAFSQAFNDPGATPCFQVLDLRRQDKYLQVKVRGGADAQAFRFIWDGRIQESAPMGIRLILQHDARRTDVNPDRIINLKVYLGKIIGQRNMEDYHFYVINGSNLQVSILNPDGSFSRGSAKE